MSLSRAKRGIRRVWACAAGAGAGALLTACTPVTTRPAFTPLPEALHAVINAPPPTVAQIAAGLLADDTIPVRFMNARDAWLETKEFAGTHRLRLWADPDVPGRARVTIEAVYRPVDDPSRTPRDLERASPPGSPGQLRAAKLLAALKDKLGVTNY
ncbi:MAG TPA: hypothetical protein VG454_09985 [Gemmatimonadales bacterium]|nr:hypothetical protein [Gemmatimonadales bacterium]